MASLEWPPYIGSVLPEQGALAIVTQAAFAKAGYKLQIDFYPWARTLHMVRTGKKYAGYFPEYFSDQIEKDFVFSDRHSRHQSVRFAERKGTPYWEHPDNLSGVKIIGTVRGSVSTGKETGNG